MARRTERVRRESVVADEEAVEVGFDRIVADAVLYLDRDVRMAFAVQRIVAEDSQQIRDVRFGNFRLSRILSEEFNLLPEELLSGHLMVIAACTKYRVRPGRMVIKTEIRTMHAPVEEGALFFYGCRKGLSIQQLEDIAAEFVVCVGRRHVPISFVLMIPYYLVFPLRSRHYSALEYIIIISGVPSI